VTNLVIDASAGVDLLLATRVGRALVPHIPAKAEWWAPEHYFSEVAGALRRLELKGALPPARAVAAVSSLATAPINRIQLRPILMDAWTKRHNLTIADALYVVVAEHLQATLVTTDLNLANAPTLTVRTIHPQS
jgi:predicted nucleic acid-binding protein